MSRKSSQRARASRRARTASERRWQAVGSLLRRLRVVALAIGAVVAVGAFALALASAAPPEGSAAGSQGSAAPAPNWVTLASTSPADVIRAARATQAFQDVYNAPQTLSGHALRGGTLGTPVLVHVYRPTPGLLDVYVIPVIAPALAPAGSHIVMLLDFRYDRAHGRLRAETFAGPFVPSDPEYGQPFPRLSAQQALARFTAQQGAVTQQSAAQTGVGGAAGAAVAAAVGFGAAPSAVTPQTELIYFPANLDQLNNASHPVTWTGGGQFPDLAVWRIGAPGRPDTIIGIDGRSYSVAQLPLAPGAAFGG